MRLLPACLSTLARAASCVAAAAALSLASSSASADETPRVAAAADSTTPAAPAADESPRFRLGAGLGVRYFAVDTGSSPPCCQEREEWTTLGPELTLRGTVQLLSWLHLGLDAGIGWQSGSEPGIRNLRINALTVQAAPHVGFDIGSVVRVRPRLGVEVLHYGATYRYSGRKDSEGSLSFGPHLGLSVAYPVTRRLEVAADVSAFALADTSAAARLMMLMSF